MKYKIIAGLFVGLLLNSVVAEAHRPIRQSTSKVVRVCGVVAVGDGFTPVTTLALSTADEAEALRDNTATLDISGATWAAITGADGCYSLPLDTTATNTVGELVVAIQDDSLTLPVWEMFQVVEEAVYDRDYAASATGLIGTSQTGDSFARIGATGSGLTTLATAAALTTVDNEIAVIDGIVDNILVDTGTTLDAALAVVDANVDAILVDTGTTLDAALAVVDGNVDSILVDTGTTLDAALAVVDANVDTLMREQHNTTIATLATQTSFTLTAGSADDNAYNGWEIVVTDAATSTQKAVGQVQDYTGTTRTVTLMVNPAIYTMAVSDLVNLRPTNANVRQMNCEEVTGTGTTGTEWSGTGDGGC